MGVYWFQCKKCGNKFSKFLSVKSSSEIMAKCEKCNEDCIQILVLNAGIVNITESKTNEKMEKIYEEDQKRFETDPDFRANFYGWDDKDHQKKVDKIINELREKNEKALNKYKGIRK